MTRWMRISGWMLAALALTAAVPDKAGWILLVTGFGVAASA